MGIQVTTYARMRGISRQAVYKAVKAGRLRLLNDGTVDPASTAAFEGSQEPEDPSGAASYLKVKTAHEMLKAKKTKLELEEMEGSRVTIDEVEGVVFSKFRNLRDQLLQLPATIGDEVVAVARTGTPEQACQAVRIFLTKELRSILEEAARAIAPTDHED